MSEQKYRYEHLLESYIEKRHIERENDRLQRNIGWYHEILVKGMICVFTMMTVCIVYTIYVTQ